MKVGIVAFAFGTPETILANRRIAEIASNKARELNSRVYTQLDIRIEDGVKVEYAKEKPGNPPPTLRIARGAVQWAKRYRLTELLVVAAKPHLWRALRDLRRAVREAGTPIEVQACPEINSYPEVSWFCLDSTQDRVRTRGAWNKRERILKLLPFFIYEV